MKCRVAHLLFLLALLSLTVLFTGCATTESDNASVRPWNSPAGWEAAGALGGMSDSQHR